MSLILTTVVSLSPVPDNLLGVPHACELFTGKAFVPKATVEALGESVLPWAIWFDVASTDFNLLNELTDTSRDELGAVIVPNDTGNTASRQQVREWFNELVDGKPSPQFHARHAYVYSTIMTRVFNGRTLAHSTERQRILAAPTAQHI